MLTISGTTSARVMVDICSNQNNNFENEMSRSWNAWDEKLVGENGIKDGQQVLREFGGREQGNEDRQLWTWETVSMQWILGVC